MLYHQDLSSTNLLDDADFKKLCDQTSAAIATLKKKHLAEQLPVLDLPGQEKDLHDLELLARAFHYSNIFVLGTGGSSLGGRSLCDLNQSPFAFASDKQRVHFFDNIDPYTLQTILHHHDLNDTGFVVISKSGSTAETLFQFLIVLEKFIEIMPLANAVKHFIVITEPKDSPIRNIAEKHHITVLDHHTAIGGRFSVLSLVGALPALFAGIDVYAARRGAKQVLDKTFAEGEKSDPAIGAAFAVEMMRRNNPIMVMMPYCDRLKSFSDWHRQLWAESLGKEGKGSTPAPALGTVDQHSQLQLFLDGPKDKAYTLIFLDYFGVGEGLGTKIAEKEGLTYLHNKTIGDLMAAEQKATAQTLINHRCPTRIFRLLKLNEEVLGALFMHFMLETMIAAELMGVNAYDQPAVEESKILTRQYLAEG